MKTSETDIDVRGSSSKAFLPIESDLEYFQRVTSFKFPTEKKVVRLTRLHWSKKSKQGYQILHQYVIKY